MQLPNISNSMLKNLKKRLEIQKKVVNNYGGLVKTEDIDHQIGHAFMGYEMALKDIVELIKDDKGLDGIKAFINEHLTDAVGTEEMS